MSTNKFIEDLKSTIQWLQEDADNIYHIDKEIIERLRELINTSSSKKILGGRNDKALILVQELGFDMFWLRALKDTGDIQVNLNCSDVFVWGSSDCEPLPDELWKEFQENYFKALDELPDECVDFWYAPAWSVKLRNIAPQKPATDRNPDFVKMLDWLEIDWRNMKRYVKMEKSDD